MAKTFTTSDRPRTCIIGAGCSGITMAKRLKDRGLPFDCFEASDEIGGNWYFNNPNGMSSCYQSLHIDTSKQRLEFEDFPVPKDWPDFPHHGQLHKYFKDYVAHFGLRDMITLNVSVNKADPLAGDRWRVTLSTGEVRDYDAIAVATGHHWDARMPTYPGRFDGYQIHSHHYREPFAPYDFRGKRVMVVGAGNSAMDIASELSQRPVAEKLFVSMRRGVWILPKYIAGQPGDKALPPPWLPIKIGRALVRAKIKRLVGKMENFGLPKPDHEPLSGHPSISEEFLNRVGCGDITPKGAIDRIDGDGVIFADGTREKIDAIVWATGYNVTFPFFDDPLLVPEENRFPAYKRMIRPGRPTAFFLGLAQPLPTLVNLAEQQSKLVAAYLAGEYGFPDDAEMAAVIVKDEKAHIGHFYDSPRHTMQIDFRTYVADLHKEIVRGAKRIRVPA